MGESGMEETGLRELLVLRASIGLAPLLRDDRPTTRR
jgi:hypothetical protein